MFGNILEWLFLKLVICMAVSPKKSHELLGYGEY